MLRHERARPPTPVTEEVLECRRLSREKRDCQGRGLILPGQRTCRDRSYSGTPHSLKSSSSCFLSPSNHSNSSRMWLASSYKLSAREQFNRYTTTTTSRNLPTSSIQEDTSARASKIVPTTNDNPPTSLMQAIDILSLESAVGIGFLY